MKKNFIVILFLLSALAILLTSCPYSSEFPLSSATEEVNKNIYGKWEKQSEYSDFPKYYIFSEVDGKKIKVEQFEFDSNDSIYSSTGVYIAHFTTIGNVKFANMMQEDVYYFYKMDFTSDDTFVLYEVTNNISEKFENSKDLYKFFEAYKNLSFFYNNDEETFKHINN